MSEQPEERAGEPDSSRVAVIAREQQCNGIRLRYLEWPGSAHASRPPIVLLHGILQTSEGMANLAEHLAPRGRVIVPDLRGRGGSEQPDGGYDPGTLADDVAGLIDGLRLERPVVIGRMHGGLVGYHLAARHPELIGGLIIGDTPPEVTPEHAAAIQALLHQLPARFASLDEAIAFYQNTLLLSEARAKHDIPHDLLPDDGGGLRWRHNLELIGRIEQASMPRADWAILSRMRCPVLVLRGQRGEIPPAMADRIAGAIADCRIATVLGARHDLFLGPGSEQALGAIDLFLMRFASPPAEPRTVSPPTVTGAAAPGGAGTAAAVIAQLVAAVNQRRPAAFEAMFAPTVHVVQFGEGGKVREGGLETARAAFGRVTSGNASTVIDCEDLLSDADRVACRFTIRNPGREATVRPHHPEPRATLIPAFLRIEHGRITELTTYHLHVPVSQIETGSAG